MAVVGAVPAAIDIMGLEYLAAIAVEYPHIIARRVSEDDARLEEIVDTIVHEGIGDIDDGAVVHTGDIREGGLYSVEIGCGEVEVISTDDDIAKLPCSSRILKDRINIRGGR